jgi:hypothetical protein
MHGEFMGSTEYADSNFLRKCIGPDELQIRDTTHTAIGHQNLCERTAVTSSLPSHSLNGMDGCTGSTGRYGEHRRQPGWMEGSVHGSRS